jgi:hypothetical protein
MAQVADERVPPVHRFWRAGRGWAMARELQAGDIVRTLGGLAKVVSVTAGPVVPLFNLDVARDRTCFVGRHDAPVHDNTPPDPRLEPFDAGTSLAAASRPVTGIARGPGDLRQFTRIAPLARARLGGRTTRPRGAVSGQGRRSEPRCAWSSYTLSLLASS